MSSGTVETHQFQAETRQLLDLMIHSIYTNKDIFLRELISNASDALDRRRFEAVSQPDLLPEGTDLHILLEPDSVARTLTIYDNGVGMSRDEVQALIGTIAKSGSKEFVDKMKQAQGKVVPPELIGQFGVGFYSSFMAADKVTLLTRKAGEETATRWESSGDGTYTLEEVDKAEPGTSITLHLKSTEEEDGLHDYTEEWKLKEIIKKYSDFVAYPIQMKVARTEKEKDEEGNVKPEGEETIVYELETLNSMKAIWLRPKHEVTTAEYEEFYKHIAHDWTAPLHTIRAHIEGTLDYTLLLYLPSHAPFDLYYREGRKGLQLYVKRVFIMDDCRELLPEWLRFVRGVVDSEDLSLNISRELLQQNRQIQRMRKGIVSKVLDELKHLKEKEGEQYRTFWKEFGPVLKEGLYQEEDHQKALLDLCLFQSSKSADSLVSLSEYVARMADGQDVIYYMTGETRAQMEHSPHLEAFTEKGLEVLFLSEPVDEIWTGFVGDYDGKSFKSISKGQVDLGTEAERKEGEETRKEKEQAHASLLDCLKSKLSEHVKEVRLSSRLTTSAACLVSEESDITPQMEQILKAMNQEAPKVKRILELNPKHPILTRLQTVYDANSEDPKLGQYAELLYGQARLAEGQPPPDPGRFAKLVTDLMVDAL